jgi:hypothetical protein
VAIQPIDLQTIYTQLDKVSKEVAFQQQGVLLKNSINQENEVQKQLNQKEAVKQAQMDEDAQIKLRDENRRQKQNTSSGEKKETQDEEEREKTNNPYLNAGFDVIKDPSLGNNIDVTG